MKYVKLKDIAAISAGQRAPQGNDFCLEGNPFVKAGNLRELTEGKQIKDIQRVSDNVAKEYGLRLYPKGTILFAKSGMSCLKGYVYVLPEDAYVVSHLACITPYNEISDYLRYYFIYNRPNRLVKDISYPSISLSDIGNIRIDLKSKDERNEIVALLDKTTCTISLLNKELQKLDYLTKARFVEMFGNIGQDNKGWGLTTLGKACIINPHRPKNINTNLDYSFVPMPSVSEHGSIDTSVCKPYKKVKNGYTYFQENDVLFAKITPCMENGKGAVAQGLKNGIGFGSTEFHVLRPMDGISNPYWLYEITMQPQFRIVAERHMTGSGGQRRVPASFFYNFPISIPPLDFQNHYADFVQKVDKSKTNFNPFNFLP